MRLFERQTFNAVAALSGTIIGVGFFSLPYITVQVGFWAMLGYFAVLGGMVIVIHWIFGEVALNTPDFLRVPGYAKIYFGERGKRIALISTILGTYGAILAYLIIGGKFLENSVSPFFGGSYLLYGLIYFFLGSLFIYFGIKPITKICFFELAIFLGILILFFFSGYQLFKVENLLTGLNFKNFFLPYGPILFSLWGAAMIPEIEEMLGEKKNLLKKVIVLSVLIPIFLYLLFAILVAGISGPKTTIDAISGLAGFLGKKIVVFGLFVGIVTTFTSFVALGITLRKVFSYDLKIPKVPAFLMVCFVPLILFLIGMTDFLKVISFIGGIMMGSEGILIVLMYHKIKKKKAVVFPLVLILLGGIIYELVNFIK